ncbi:hypothetical protein DYB32_005754 [Aphanomyces invadans]|nr:hypothetical protein DYB32_005754 [Aphanomyces invadans]
MVVKAGILYKYNSPLLWWRPRWTAHVYTLSQHDLQACDIVTGKVVAVVPLANCRLTHWCTERHRDIEWFDLGRPRRHLDDGLVWRLRLQNTKKPWATVHLAVATERDAIEWMEALQAIPTVTTLENDSASTTASAAASSTTHRATISGTRSSTVLLKSAINHSLQQYDQEPDRWPPTRIRTSKKC